MKKIFFFDIDGTLAIQKQIPQNNINALQKLKEQGHLTFICTGRAPYYAKNLFKDLVSGYITCNGRYIIYQDQKLHGEAFSIKELEEYENQLKQLRCGYLLVTDNYSIPVNLTMKQKNEVIQEYSQEHILETREQHPIYTFDIFYETLKQRDHIRTTLQDQLVINDHGGHGSCDCSTRNFDKGHAIKYLLHYFHLTPDDAYAFGDGYNDQAMFREVTHGIAMGNAVAELKKKATYITDNVERDGITKALIHEKIFKKKEG